MNRRKYRALRRQFGTQAQAAKALGVHPMTVSKREAGRLAVTREAALAVEALAQAGAQPRPE